MFPDAKKKFFLLLVCKCAKYDDRGFIEKEKISSMKPEKEMKIRTEIKCFHVSFQK